MVDELTGKKVVVLATDGVEQVELTGPRQALAQAGAQVDLVSLRSGEIQAMNGDIDKADRFPVDREVSQVSVRDYDALVLPGGTINPDQLRRDGTAVSFVRDFVASGKPVGAICHGPWTLVEAGVVRGRQLTSFPSIRTDIRNAGGEVTDQEVVVDDNLVTSRNPGDLPAFHEAVIKAIASS
ncbi:type 1 glutamine amidotransferase domain-containing protein [Saccharopolyspora sp. TS4A08]|uniref:Type 1 glutamine amidotransferase domain-containing protein n=1 Tax=Saccharopolyspora ipomoeae TaxID=3042027 RepID=A0ABT6PW92_9PSEU|nr:type 1 glutamine amidotransferase domain-containing protein [Saccharopolyspora sp. TS4A08]MDI2032226.1 type 1 glutamine amidotransferase domain-containing protein [Saccharopolyspora sp. TS4A08]